MRLGATIQEAIGGLTGRVSRAALAVLMTATGVATVIVLVGLLGGAEQDVARRIRNLGATVISVLPGSVTAGGARLGYGTLPTLSDENLAMIERELDGVVAAAAWWWAGGPAVAGARNWTTRIHGVTPGAHAVRSWWPERGRQILDEDMRSFAKVAVIGETIAKKLFPDDDPVGQQIRLRNVPFRVIGVLGAKGQTFSGQDQDDLIWVPLTTARLRINTQLGPEFKRVSAVTGRDRFRTPGEAEPFTLKSSQVINPAAFHARSVNIISVRFADDADMQERQLALEALLRQRRVASDLQEDGFQVRNHAEIARLQTETTRTLKLLVAAGAALAILVSGAGIMNTMLISVSERIPEIGVRLAVGARRHDILAQFLVEAGVLAMIGALAGLGLGYGIVALITALKLTNAVLIGEWVGLVLAAAVATGLFFGFYPAWRGARLDPVRCLRES